MTRAEMVLNKIHVRLPELNFGSSKLLEDLASSPADPDELGKRWGLLGSLRRQVALLLETDFSGQEPTWMRADWRCAFTALEDKLGQIQEKIEVAQKSSEGYFRLRSAHALERGTSTSLQS